MRLQAGHGSDQDLATLAGQLRRSAELCDRLVRDGVDSVPADLRLSEALRRLLAMAPHNYGESKPINEPARITSGIVRLLGEFSVELDGRDATPARGNGAALVKLLALRGPLTGDELIDLLWPDIDIVVGHARLRNTLSRLRRTSGDVVIRRAGQLRIHPAVRVDARDFLTAAEQVRHGGPDRIADARRAFASFTGDLLPGDRYVEWFDDDRERVRRRYLDLADVLCSDAEQRGELDDAIDVLDRAVAIDPLDERRAVRLADLLLSGGRHAGGRRAVERALWVSGELGVPPSSELVRLVERLATRAAVVVPPVACLSA